MRQSTKGLTLQRRHFEFIAETIRKLPSHPDLHLVANVFATALLRTNPQFDVGRFLNACDGIIASGKKKKAKATKPMPDGALSLKEIHQAKRMVEHA